MYDPRNDFYKVLGVEPSASVEDIKRAFRSKARAVHPDRNPGDPRAEDRAKRVNAAGETLRDANTRRAYDRARAEYMQAKAAAGATPGPMPRARKARAKGKPSTRRAAAPDRGGAARPGKPGESARARGDASARRRTTVAAERAAASRRADAEAFAATIAGRARGSHVEPQTPAAVSFAANKAANAEGVVDKVAWLVFGALAGLAEHELRRRLSAMPSKPRR